MLLSFIFRMTMRIKKKTPKTVSVAWPVSESNVARRKNGSVNDLIECVSNSSSNNKESEKGRGNGKESGSSPHPGTTEEKEETGESEQTELVPEYQGQDLSQ